MRFTFHNSGSVTSFPPKRITVGPDGNSVTLLDMYKEMVRDADRRDVYIMDNKGRDIYCGQAIAA